LSLVVDASVALKRVLQEPDSHVAEALVRIEPELLIPDFWLGEATNVLWVQVRRKLLTPDEAREGLALLRALIQPTPTGAMDLHEVALEIGIAANHSTYRARAEARLCVTPDADFDSLLTINGERGPSVIRIRKEGLDADRTRGVVARRLGRN
jgi:predicted nucleic acid-binding protein